MTGTILSIADQRVTLSYGMPEGCFGCMRQECKNRGHIVTAANPLGLPLAVGQTVEVETSRSEFLRQALQALIPPAAGFFAGFMLAGVLFPRGGEPFRVVCGLAACFAAAGITYAARKRFSLSALPRVTGICAVPFHSVK